MLSPIQYQERELGLILLAYEDEARGIKLALGNLPVDTFTYRAHTHALVALRNDYRSVVNEQRRLRERKVDGGKNTK